MAVAKGDRTQATVWSYAPVAAVNMDRARTVLQATKRQANERAEKLATAAAEA